VLEGQKALCNAVHHWNKVSIAALLLYCISSFKKKKKRLFLNLFLFKVLEPSSGKIIGLKLLLFSDYSSHYTLFLSLAQVLIREPAGSSQNLVYDLMKRPFGPKTCKNLAETKPYLPILRQWEKSIL